MISSGSPTISRKEIIDKVNEADILGYYLKIPHIPIVINSPFRKDTKPSFYIYTPNGIDVNYIDLATSERGGSMNLLMKLWGVTRSEVYQKIQKDLLNITSNCDIQGCTKPISKVYNNSNAILQCKIRDWEDYDILYWNSYGITIKWLKYCEVYPISYKIITKNGKTSTFRADKYAYVFIERKDNQISYKFYQPYNKNGFKWQSGMDKSVISLWTKLPKQGKSVIICSSLKDSLCLMSNLKIPCIAPQGEGYPISDTAINELKKRFTNIYVLYDNDEVGIKDSKLLCEKHNLIHMEIPQFEGGKDISDYYKTYGKEKFKQMFRDLIINTTADYYNELPF